MQLTERHLVEFQRLDNEGKPTNIMLWKYITEKELSVIFELKKNLKLPFRLRINPDLKEKRD